MTTRHTKAQDVQSGRRQWTVSLRPSSLTIYSLLMSYFAQTVLAQAPVNDVISWPSGILLLASVLYAALGNAPDRLWEIEPAAGFFLFSGLPMISIPTMNRVTWVANACHFVSRIRSASGKYNFWVRAETIPLDIREDALKKAARVLSCVVYEDRPSEPFNTSLWRVTSAGLVQPSHFPSSVYHSKPPPPTARDFLLFAATDYHVFREWEVEIHSNDTVVFSSKGMPASSVIDVDSETAAIHVVAAQMVRRPYQQSPLCGMATNTDGKYILKMESLDLDVPACAIDFHSYSPESYKVSASVRELAHSYYTVVRHLKHASNNPVLLPTGHTLARVSVGQSLWIAILGGALLDKGRLTIQNLPGRWAMAGVTPGDAYLSRIDSVLEQLEPYAGKTAFDDVVYSSGINRRSAIPFFIAGVFGQAIICYFLSVGTSAGVFTSVVLANSLYAGRLNDWHSIYWGKMDQSVEPGMKMYLPGTKDLMCIATFDRTAPREGELRQGFTLNLIGLVAAVFGSIFQRETRDALGFSEFTPTPPWVVYTSAVLCVGTSLLVATAIASQQARTRTWWQGSELPTRWMVYSTIPASFVVAGLAVFFQVQKIPHFWPILDALTWISGIPLGMIENGRMIPTDDNMLHLILLNRWMMGAVASSVGSSQI